MRLQVAIAVDQLANALLGGWADETISARAWRNRDKNKAWAFLRWAIDTAFFLQRNHCYQAFLSEALRRQLPAEYGDAAD